MLVLLIKGDKMNFDVVTFGSSVIDIFIDTGLSLKNGNMVYRAGSKIQINNSREDFGGGGSTSAVAFSRLGFKTGCITKVGDDFNGKKIINSFKKEGVKFLGRIEKNSKTDFSIILDSKEHNRTILVNKKINNEIDFKDINFKKIKTKWIYFSSVLGKSFKTQVKIARELHKKGVKIAFNPSEYLIKNENILLILKICDVFVLNKEEAELLTNEKDLLKGLYKLCPKVVVITNGSKLISCFDGKKKYFLKPKKVEVVELTGAGDAFASGFVAAQIKDKSINESLKLGLRMSESVIKHFGARNNLLKRRLK